MGYFIRLRVYERVGVSLVEVCEWVGKSVISVVKRLRRADRSDTFYVCEKVERTFCFFFLTTRYVKGIPLVNGRYTKGVPFLSKIPP